MNILDRKFGNVTVILLVTTLLLTSGVFATACSDDLNPRESQRADVVFDDVSQDDWFHRYVSLGLRFGIIQGVSDNGSLRFEPNRSVTRAEFITMLGRLHEYGNETIGTPGEGTFFERYLDWAVKNELIHGNEHGDLMPESFVTREQMVVIVHRYIMSFELHYYFLHELMLPAEPLTGNISDWALSSVEYYRVNIRVSGSWYFRHKDFATRAETVEIFARICSAVYDQRHPLWFSPSITTTNN